MKEVRRLVTRFIFEGPRSTSYSLRLSARYPTRSGLYALLRPDSTQLRLWVLQV